MYLLDTNVVSELRKARPHGAVVAWLESVSDADLHLSAVTLGEIQAGVEITREQDAAKAAEIEAWLELVAGTWNVLAADGRVFRAWARLMHRRSDAADRGRADRGHGLGSRAHGRDPQSAGLRAVRGDDARPVRGAALSDGRHKNQPVSVPSVPG